MACAGVVASAGAQISMVFVTVKERSQAVGKSTFTYFGHSNQYTGSSVSGNPMEFANGASEDLTTIERGSNNSANVAYDTGNMPANSVDCCNSFVFTGADGTISRLTMASGVSSYRPGGTTSINFNSTQVQNGTNHANAFINSNNDILIFELRAD